MGMATIPHPNHQFSTFSCLISYFKPPELLQWYCSQLAELVLIMLLGSEKKEFGVQPAPESNGKRWTRLSEREIASEGPQETTDLHRAVKQGQTQTVAKLVSRFGGAVDQCDIYGRTPLHYVAAQQHAGELTQTLLKNGANVDAVDSQNLTPLHAVAYVPQWGDEPEGKGRISVAAQLVDNGAEVNTRDVFGESPLHDAAKRGDKELMKLLLQHGADSECRNFDDQTPQEVLPQTEHKPELERLLRSIRNWDSDTAHACRAIPSDPPQCWNSGPGGETDDPTNICRKFFASVRFFYREREYSQSWSVLIHDLLHHPRGNSRIQKLEEEFFDLVQERFEVDKDRIRNNCWKWIHLPVNQMSWVTDLVWRLTDDLDESGTISSPSEKRKEGWRFLERNLAQRKGANPGVYIRVPHAGDVLRNKNVTEQKTQEDLDADQGQDTDHRPEMDHESWKDTSTDTENTSPSLYQREIWRDSTHLLDDRKFSLVVPYIDFETEQYLQRFEKSKGSYRIKTPRIRDKCELEVVSRPYKGLMGLHKSQSLDESQYDMLSEEDLRKRDEDQVVFKWSKDNIKKPTFTKGRNVALPPRKNIGEGDDRNISPDNLKFKTYPNKKGKEVEFGQDTRDASQLPRLLMVHQLWLWKLDKDTVITAFPDRYHRGVEDSLFDTIRQGGIDSYRSPHQLIEDILYESVTFLDEFRYAGLGIHVLDIFDSSIAKCSDEEAACFEVFRKKLGKDDRGPEQINPEIELIRQCKDIRDELHLLLRVFEMQQNVVKRFADLVWSSQSEMNKVFIEDCGVGYLIERTKSLDRHAQRTLQELDYLVQTEQAQISLEEAHSAGQLNKIIWLFTLITVIFTPLSFMTSLFAIPFNYFPQNAEGEIRVEGSWIASRMTIGEFASVVPIAAVILVILGPSTVWKKIKEYPDAVRTNVREHSKSAWGSSVKKKLGNENTAVDNQENLVSDRRMAAGSHTPEIV